MIILKGLNLLLDPFAALGRVGVIPPNSYIVRPLRFQAAGWTFLSLQDGLDTFLARAVDFGTLDLFLRKLLYMLEITWCWLHRRLLENKFLG